ncbi:MAG: HlyD family efflux transporter periplasmic adaptor subunit [bacterium]|nr:HlyD family efflux transporter periplasmic adaptor subunit [bacterium]
MKNKSIIMLYCASLVLGCKTAPKELDETEITNPKTPVEVTNINYGSLDDELILSASTIYQKRNLVTATIPAFIVKVNVRLGDAVIKGQLLYELESKERRSLGTTGIKLDSSLAGFGLIKIRASASGVISTLDKQQPGDYVLEGTLLCTISESSDLTFQVNVPYEYIQFAKTGKACTIVLPDNSIHKAQFTKSLTTMNAMAQTQTVLAKSNEVLFLPENMIVKVIVNKGLRGNNQIVPKECVLSDEMMKEFWVMKLLNDTTAIRVPVTIGNNSDSQTEILAPIFESNATIVRIGNYGLTDTALVIVQNLKNK